MEGFLPARERSTAHGLNLWTLDPRNHSVEAMHHKFAEYICLILVTIINPLKFKECTSIKNNYLYGLC